MRTLILILMAGLIAGCAHTEIVPVGSDSYMITRQGGYGQTSSATVEADALKDANSFCEDKGKKFQPVNASQSPFYFGHTPEAQVSFMCLDAGDSQLARPGTIPTTIQSVTPAAAPAMPMFHPATFTPAQVYQMPVHRQTQTNCTSNMMGGSAYTNCSSY